MIYVFGYGKHLTRLSKYAALINDDWGLAKFNDKERREIFEVLKDRHNITSTIISSQIPVDKWLDSIGNPTIADAVLDRLVHNTHMIAMKGESMRKMQSKAIWTTPTIRALHYAIGMNLL